ncbi:vesicular transporter [Thelephora terrestris]|uniref:Vacuolar protein sorting-associated protein 51 homolog n=1 Tax=Thelephora terrestris TaxID=56493 RepID=A0A9P6HN12_9AGAM|nr:vesicular transporter [Thelephora terrestris]
MASPQSSPPSTPPPRPSSTRPFGSPLRPQSPPLPSGIASSNPRTRVSSHQSTPPTRSDSVHRSSSGPANASTASLPNPNQSDRTRSRARDLLRKHYGLGVGPPPPSGKPQDPMDLDSPAFDAKAYYEQLITTSSLATLLKRESELLSEIRSLDSDRQSLVYNHHHELIAASDTISAMKARADELDPQLDALKAAFSEISRLSSKLANERHADD